MKNLKKLKIVFISVVLNYFFVVICNAQSTSEQILIQRRFFDVFTSSPYENVTSPDDGNATIKTTSYSTFFSDNDTDINDSLSRISEKVSKDSFFGSFNPLHISAVTDLIDIFMMNTTNATQGMPDMLTVDTLLQLVERLKKDPSIHPRVWYASFSITLLLTMPDMVQVNRPSGIELFPSLFFPIPVLEEKTNEKECVLADERIGADNGFENRLWYFREDVQLNNHHWNWHLRHPTSVNQTIDRRGESFYFVHHDLLARYNAERLANGLQLTEPLDMQMDTVLEEGYNPHLKDGISNRLWVERKPFKKLHDSLSSVEQSELASLITERNRVLDAINQEGVLHNNGFVEIHGNDRINLLGDLAEASIKSINPEHYGALGYHAKGHVLMSRVDAEEGSNGVLIDLGATMRDPMFYRWHTYIDLLFQAYKITLLKPHAPHGGTFPLVFKGIKVNSVQVVQEVESDEEVLVPVNHLETFWNIQRFDLAGGIDVNQNSSSPVVNICSKHLDHHNFYYELEIESSFEKSTLGTVRIFMAPRYKSAKSKKRFSMGEQRSLFFAMDSFQTVLEPGKNILVRRSIDSSLTADWPKSIKELRRESETGKMGRTVCECGFPQHLLLPKGREKGMVFDLFVMVTDGITDIARDNSTTPRSNPGIDNQCPPSHIHCGLPGRKYPDSKPMGYPFDRKPYAKQVTVKDSSGEETVINKEVANLEAYIKDIPNMHASQVTIQHHDEVRGSEYFEATETYKPLRLKKF